MNKFLEHVLAYYDFNFEREVRLTKYQLQQEYAHLDDVVKFGKHNCQTFYDLMIAAQEHYNRLMGSTSCTIQQANQQETPKPVVDRSHEGLPAMGPTTGPDVWSALKDDRTEDPWFVPGGYPWAQEAHRNWYA